MNVEPANAAAMAMRNVYIFILFSTLFYVSSTGVRLPKQAQALTVGSIEQADEKHRVGPLFHAS